MMEDETRIDKMLSTVKLDAESKDIAQQILDEDNVDKLKDLTTLFNLNQSKKNALRVLKLSSLLDKVSDQMVERVEKRPGEFSNEDLVKYMNVIQGAIDKADKSLGQVETTPAITVNTQNNTINIGGEEALDRTSKIKVADAIKAILDKISASDIQVDGDIQND